MRPPFSSTRLRTIPSPSPSPSSFTLCETLEGLVGKPRTVVFDLNNHGFGGRRGRARRRMLRRRARENFSAEFNEHGAVGEPLNRFRSIFHDVKEQKLYFKRVAPHDEAAL